eukprot:jgi/Psemu1/305544/fgenesh1_kg.204_\
MNQNLKTMFRDADNDKKGPFEFALNKKQFRKKKQATKASKCLFSDLLDEIHGEQVEQKAQEGAPLSKVTVS